MNFKGKKERTVVFNCRLKEEKMSHRDVTHSDGVSVNCTFCRGKNILCRNNQKPSSSTELPSCGMAIELLPESVLLQVFSFLGFKELLVIRRVSSRWKRVAEDRQLWRALNLSCKRIHPSNVLFRLPETISQHVKVVNLMWAYISIPAFKCVKAVFRNTEILLLQHCKFSIQSEDKSYQDLAALPTKLKILDARNVQGRWFDDAGPISSLFHTEAMAFSHTMPSDWLSQLSLTWLPKLRIINIQNNPCVNDMFLKGLVKNSPNVKSLWLQGCMSVSGAFLKEAIDSLPELCTLDLSGTRLEGRNVHPVSWESSKIQNLNISFCCKIMESDLKIMLPKMKHLRHLKASFVGWGRSLSEDVIREIIDAKSTKLESVDVQSTFALPVSSIIALCKHNPQLRHLRLGTIIKTKEELEWLLASVSQVESLSLQLGEANFTAATLFKALASRCVELKSLFIYNISVESCQGDTLRSSLVSLFTKCSSLRNFFSGGYPYKQKQTIDKIVTDVTKSLRLSVNCNRAVAIIPQPTPCFDEYLCNALNDPGYNSRAIKQTFQHSINSQMFYKTGLQKLDNMHFALLRT